MYFSTTVHQWDVFVATKPPRVSNSQAATLSMFGRCWSREESQASLDRGFSFWSGTRRFLGISVEKNQEI